MTTEIYEAPNFQISNDPSASQPPTENLKFEQEDWTAFRTVENLQRKAGVSLLVLRRLGDCAEAAPVISANASSASRILDIGCGLFLRWSLFAASGAPSFVVTEILADLLAD